MLFISKKFYPIYIFLLLLLFNHSIKRHSHSNIKNKKKKEKTRYNTRQFQEMEYVFFLFLSNWRETTRRKWRHSCSQYKIKHEENPWDEDRDGKSKLSTFNREKYTFQINGCGMTSCLFLFTSSFGIFLFLFLFSNISFRFEVFLLVSLKVKLNFALSVTLNWFCVFCYTCLNKSLLFNYLIIYFYSTYYLNIILTICFYTFYTHMVIFVEWM